jgi:hypothetical protein
MYSNQQLFTKPILLLCAVINLNLFRILSLTCLSVKILYIFYVFVILLTVLFVKILYFSYVFVILLTALSTKSVIDIKSDFAVNIKY